MPTEITVPQVNLANAEEEDKSDSEIVPQTSELKSESKIFVPDADDSNQDLSK